MGIACTTLVALNQFNVAQMKIVANAKISPSFIETVLYAVYGLFYWQRKGSEKLNFIAQLSESRLRCA